MSIQGCAYSEAAAKEILEAIKTKIAENESKPEVVAVLREIEKVAEGIRKSSVTA